MDRLEPQGDEVAVISLAAIHEGDGWRLGHGSVLIGPACLGQLSWPEWHERDRHPAEVPVDLSVFGVTESEWRTFDYVVGDWRLVRFVLAVNEVVDWLTEVLAEECALLPNGARLLARAEPAEALLNVFQHGRAPSTTLAAMARRPVLGWVHPLAAVPDQLLPAQWNPAPGHDPFPATLELLGLSVNTTTGIGSPPHGLLVGRLRREAWITSVRGRQGTPELETLEVRLRLDPSRASLWDLTVDLEETNRAGELMSARRVRLADLVLPAHGTHHATVPLPTLGRQVVQRLRLYDLDGRGPALGARRPSAEETPRRFGRRPSG